MPIFERQNKFLHPTEWVNKFGQNADVDTSKEDLVAQGGTVVQPTEARVHNIASSDAKDTNAGAGGVGARTIRISGLDGDFDEVSEDIELDGVSNVATTFSYTRINRMIVLTAGSELDNAGIISATAVTDGTVTCTIPIGYNQSLYALYTIPRNKTGYMTDFYISIDPDVNATVTAQVEVRNLNEVWAVKQIIKINDTLGHVEHEFNPPLEIKSKADVKITVISSAINELVDGGFDIILK